MAQTYNEKQPTGYSPGTTDDSDIAPATSVQQHGNYADDNLKQAAYGDDANEVFQTVESGVNFRTLTWPWTTVIFLKITFAVGVMGVPTALYALGAVPGAINILGWGTLNTYVGVIFGNFRMRHAKCHSVGDMAGVAGGKIAYEVTGVWFVVTWLIFAGSCVNGSSTALNALSDHATCTNTFQVVVAIGIFLMASIRKFEKLTWISWLGFFTLFTGIFIVVVGVTTLDRPATAPKEGPYELGYMAVNHPTFIAGMSASATIFSGNAGTPAFLPVISEMKNPRDYNKALYICNIFAVSAYLAFGLVVYRYAGMWVASPSLGTAGPLLKKVAYGFGLFGIMVTGALYTHVPAKYMFVRMLRNTRHLQSNTWVHWGTWLGITFLFSLIAFIVASAVPIFNYIISIAGSLGLGPMAVMLPAWLWLYDHHEFRRGSIWQVTQYVLHWLMLFLGAFLCVGGTYSGVASVVEAYKNGDVGGVFSCADNSNTVVAVS